MKKFAFLCGLVAAFLCLAQNAHAQYAGPIHRQGANLADARGNILSDHEVLALIGEQVYDETYVGAVKQRKTGKTLIWSGIGGLVGGAVLYGVGVSKVSGQVNQNSSQEDIQKALQDNPGSAEWCSAERCSWPLAASPWMPVFPSLSSARSASTGWPTTTMPGKA